MRQEIFSLSPFAYSYFLHVKEVLFSRTRNQMIFFFLLECRIWKVKRQPLKIWGLHQWYLWVSWSVQGTACVQKSESAPKRTKSAKVTILTLFGSWVKANLAQNTFNAFIESDSKSIEEKGEF